MSYRNQRKASRSDELLNVVKTCSCHTRGIADSLQHQTVGNIDQVVHELRNRFGDEVGDEARNLLRVMVKDPTIRQIARLKGIIRSFEDFF